MVIGENFSPFHRVVWKKKHATLEVDYSSHRCQSWSPIIKCSHSNRKLKPQKQEIKQNFYQNRGLFWKSSRSGGNFPLSRKHRQQLSSLHARQAKQRRLTNRGNYLRGNTVGLFLKQNECKLKIHTANSESGIFFSKVPKENLCMLTKNWYSLNINEPENQMEKDTRMIFSFSNWFV